LERVTWNRILDPDGTLAERNERRHRALRRSKVFAVIAILMMLSAIGVGAWPVSQWIISSNEQAHLAAEVAAKVEGWPYPQAEDALRAAREYNKKLASHDQWVLGEAEDPFLTASGKSEASDANSSASSRDKEYMSLLNAQDGAMGSIRIPKISVNLPIYHGTSQEALEKGAGHLYGSSLPVGGKDTHAVLTGHRGMVSALMFTRLDEMVVGDAFYINVMGETYGYKVDRISVIDPDDTSKLRIVKGEDRVTLMTCTPYGVNTQRLLVSGIRSSIPLGVPEPDAGFDWWIILAVILLLVIPWLIGAFTWMRHRNRWMHMFHAADRRGW
jgi:sortase A